MPDTEALESWRHWAGLPPDTSFRSAPGVEAARERFKRIMSPPSPEVRGQAIQDQAFVASADRAAFALARGSGAAPAPFWPEQRPYAVCITHDIDRTLATYQRLRGFRSHPIRSVRSVLRDCWTASHPSLRPENTFHNFKAIHERESALGVSSCFYVLFEKVRIFKAILEGEVQHAAGVYSPASIGSVLRELEASGHEIGIHASFSSWNQADALADEIRSLHGLGVKGARGMRTHYLLFDPLKTPLIGAGCGLSYDSSIGFNYLVGFRAGTCFPYRLGNIWELPLLLMDTALRSLKVSPAATRQAAFRVRDEVRAMGGVLTLNWHSHLLNPAANAEAWELVEELITQGKADGAWMALPRDVISWWEKRACLAS